jgi:hypothetical protein
MAFLSDGMLHAAVEVFMTGFDPYSLQIQIKCCKTGHTTDITLHIVRNYFFLYYSKYSPYQKMFKMNIECLVLCHEPMFELHLKYRYN